MADHRLSRAKRRPTHLSLLIVALAGATAHAQSVHTTNRWHSVLNQPAEWYASTEAQRIADNVLLYQNDNGGWPKNINMARVLTNEEQQLVLRERDSRGSIIDNGATYTQLELLARVATATGEAKYREALLRGIDYLLDAQYDNGGWPMFYPLRPGYYEHITFNDGAMIGVMRLLRGVAGGEPPYAMVDSSRRARAEAAVGKGIQAILACQVRVDGKPTVWCAQHDRQSLQPAKARSYELPSLSGSESVGIVEFLMDIDNPTPEVIESIEGAVAWFKAVQLRGIRLERVRDPNAPRGFDFVVRPSPDAPPMWARFYEIGTNRPMFVGRDGVVRDHLADIEIERRTSYAYLGRWPSELLDKDYPEWQRRVGRN